MLYILAVIINVFLSLLEYSIIIECVCSWLGSVQDSAFYAFLMRINSPFLNPVRKLVSKFFPDLPFDISPLVMIFIIGMIRKII